ncbi:hypothetical protein C8A05DRAFT_48491 [Staphylotrichum tortipilum]|uniref:Zn(2)-C6 fungal-type domain-containing protein n=1 Tax=Staphylotrichum tortipilum TaxID=2831512 RepID=A0AAN6M7E8_9PEZI|nr:hypothetical protein C8A05DRAFT_48491 [Staphylotrichum longicolle]
MSDRVAKKSSKTIQRATLAATIDELGFEVMPCSFCHSKGLRCKMLERSSRCGECVRRGRSCDGSGVPVSALDRIVAESRRLDSEEQDAEEALRAERLALAEAQKASAEAQRRLDESWARLDRLRRQKRMLLSRGGDMVRRGLESLDEMEEADRREANAAGDPVDMVDWDAAFVVPPELPLDLSFSGGPSFLVDQGSFDGTRQASQGSEVQDFFDVPFFFLVFCFHVCGKPCRLGCWFKK